MPQLFHTGCVECGNSRRYGGASCVGLEGESSVFSLQHRIRRGFASGIVTCAVAGLALAVPAPASAQGLFDFLFGKPRAPSSASSYADPNAPTDRPDAGPRYDSSSGVAYCVRLCDGRYFPIQRASGANVAQVCTSFCPAARTKVFSGGAINHAVANDGARYADLPTAFAYRDRLVSDCTCNGKDAYGLVTTTVNDDPTLRPGDIVATEQGFVAYNGGSGSQRLGGEFTPIESYGGLSADVRQKLASAKIMPHNATPLPDQSTAAAGDRRVQLGR
ncbi:MAG: hypothetical protein C5B56_03320 [Proteobacteria bacterium]|nr:MAG: hypothetical protein C5B56_03320 [Pseudomonadota bacterium]